MKNDILKQLVLVLLRFFIKAEINIAYVKLNIIYIKRGKSFRVVELYE